MKKTICEIMAILLLTSMLTLTFNIQQAGSSGPPATEWSRTYGGTNDDGAHSVVQTRDGGYVVVGNTQSFGAGGIDIWLVKTDRYGNMEWNKTYGGAMNDDVTGWSSVVQTSDEGYAIVGHTYSFGAGSADFWLIKTDEFGNMQWDKTYGGTSYDVALSLMQTSDGGFILAGQTYSFGSGWCNAWLVKTDEFGNMEWNKTYGRKNYDLALSFVQTSDGGYALAGRAASQQSFSDGDFWLVKTDSAGNMQWDKTYGGTGEETAHSVVQTIDGGYALVGLTNSFGAGSFDTWLVKIDYNGDMEWNQTYGGANIDWAHHIVQTYDEGYALAGAVSIGTSVADFWLVKTDDLGNIEWNETYGGPNEDIAYSLVHTSDGGYLLAGFTESFGAGDRDFWLVRTRVAGYNSLNVAEKAAIWVISQAEDGNPGYKWKRTDPNGPYEYYPFTFQWGASGIGTFLLTLYEKTGNSTYLDYAKGAGDWIVSQALDGNPGYKWPHYDADRPYTGWFLNIGVSGIGEFLLNLYGTTGNTTYLDYANGAAAWLISRVITSPLGGSYIYYGLWPPEPAREALAATFLLHLYEETGNSTLLQTVKDTATWLFAIAIPESIGYRWQVADGFSHAFPNAITARVADCLYEWYSVIGDNEYLQYANGGLEWVISQAEVTGDKARWLTNEKYGSYVLTSGCYEQDGHFFIADYLLRGYSITANSTYKEYAVMEANWIVSLGVPTNGGIKFPTVEGGTDFNSGVNARVFRLLQMIRGITGNVTYQDVAEDACAWIEYDAAEENNGYKWLIQGSYRDTYNSGFEGASGIGYYLISTIAPPVTYTISLSSEITDIQNAEYLSNFGTVSFDDTTYILPDTVSKEAGSYTATANPPDGYIFDHWQYSGGIFLSDEHSQTTTVTISNDGELISVFEPKEPHLALMATYFPQYHFSLGENWYPCSFHFDDDDIANNFPTSEDPIGNYHRYYLENGHYPPYCVYIHEVEDAEYLTIQYWLYYGYSRWWVGDIPLVSHSHDWETVWVIFDKEYLGEPYGAAYFAHGESMFYSWESVFKAEGTNHPIVCVALGTHASYHPLVMAESLFKRFPKDNWIPGGQTLDYDDFSSVLVFGNYLKSTSDADISFSLIGYDTVSAFGTGILHPVYHEGHWPNRLPPNYPSWVPEPVKKFGATADPAPWRRINGDELWKDQDGQPKIGLWDATLPEFPKYIKMAVACPIDIHIYDSLNRHVGRNYETGEIETEIPNIVFEEFPDGEYVLIKTPTQEDYHIELFGIDDGNYMFIMTVVFNGTFTDLVDFQEISEGVTRYYSASISPTGETRAISWEYVFEDTKRGTLLRISTDDKYFQFVAPDKTFSVKYDPEMVVFKHLIFICYEDEELKLVTLAIDTKLDFCIAYAQDMQTGNEYWLVDKPNWRRGGCSCFMK